MTTLNPPARPSAPSSRAARPARPAPRRVRHSPLGRGLNLGVCAVAGLYTLLPLVWLLFAITKTLPDLYGSNGFAPSGFHLWANLRDLFAQDGGVYPRWLLNSVLYAGAGAGLGTLASVMAGYTFAKYRFPGREKLYGLVVAGVLVPGTALAVPLYLLFSGVHLTNTVWSVLIPVAANPFGVYLARVYAAGSIPDELLEAARVDGAGELRTFFTVGLRLMGPGALTIFLMQFVSIWNNFFLPLVMLTDSRLFTTSLGLFTWNSSTSQNPDYLRMVVVGSAVSVVPLLILFLTLQRWWRRGLAEGGLR
ncbi:carbohydrate ABC transporter permease [Streptacidiphilus sp. N1-10]|uniref:Carbohydrate ABC transporter permease n=1 Tax=Streptacidiphilus jeojiensis TaxID=3229225 RepID=A0ABV6XZS2_9ACTN